MKSEPSWSMKHLLLKHEGCCNFEIVLWSIYYILPLLSTPPMPFLHFTDCMTKHQPLFSSPEESDRIRFSFTGALFSPAPTPSTSSLSSAPSLALHDLNAREGYHLRKSGSFQDKWACAKHRYRPPVTEQQAADGGDKKERKKTIRKMTRKKKIRTTKK